nr:uridine-cytidine kinase C-like [Tanacetum cinerariifolium]
EWVTDSPFVISPRITFEVSVRLLGGLMALGYTIASILKRTSHVFVDDRVCVKIDWLEQIGRHYVQVQGRDRVSVRCVAEQLGLEGSYVPRTYVELMQLEKLVNEVTVLPEDLKTKLSIDDEMLSSPRETHSLTATRNNFFQSRMSHSYSTARDKNLTSISGYAINSPRFDDKNTEPTDTTAIQGAISHLTEQIFTLNDRMDEFTSRIDAKSSEFSRTFSGNQQINESSNGAASTSYFTSSLANSSSNGSQVRHSSSFTQLAKDSPLVEEISGIAQSQRKIMHQLDNINKHLYDEIGERTRQERRIKQNNGPKVDAVAVSIVLALAIGGLGVFLFKGVSPRN